ncbi:29504_t:CDS:2 [Gigaspora margarita]|uniref:29504_t:CDS:1 n=1 Tax=Gigaspora margarita TaxID=4874 RepID=A0ABN7VBF8_GIGMA|nr:29504_t:CDS:2 [Gigaspora margarita]
MVQEIRKRRNDLGENIWKDQEENEFGKENKLEESKSSSI